LLKFEQINIIVSYSDGKLNSWKFSGQAGKFSNNFPFSGKLVLADLLVKVPRSGDNEVTFSVFESSCHLLLPA